MASFSPSDIQTLIGLFDDSDWEELHPEMGDLELFLAKDPKASLAGAASSVTVSPPPAPAATAAATSEAAATAPGSRAESIPDGLVALRAPNLGTFYRAPKPGAPNYVEIGQQVEPDTEVCLIEVMKLFTPVRAGMRGIVRQLCVEDAELVEFDQPLFYIEPIED